MRTTFLVVIGSLLLARWAGAGPVEIFVAADGDDSASGSAGAPLRSIGAAQFRVRERRHGGDAGPFIVTIAGGLYVLSQPLVFEPDDSGMPGVPVVYRAASGARVVVSAGEKLGPWEVTRRDDGVVWRAEVPADLRPAPGGGRPSFHQIWIGDEPRALARYPDTGYLHLQDVPDVPPNTTWSQGQTWFRFKEADAAIWKRVKAGDGVVGFTRWVDTHLTVASVDPASRRVDFTHPAVFLFSADDLYFLEGSQAFLDAPGEWCLDDDGAHVLYVPMAGEAPESSRAVAPRLHEIVHFAGHPEAAGFVGDIRFEGITFSHAAWWFEPDFRAAWPSPNVQGFVQAAVGVPGAIRAEGARRVEFRGCTVSLVEGYGIELGRGCTENTVSRCTITRLGAGGVKIGETAIRANEAELTVRNRLEDCVISDGGLLHHQAVGVWIGQSSGNLISHNRITDFHYTGISIGWTWGYGPALGGENIVEGNEVGFIGRRSGNDAEPPLGDMGGIYTLGAQPGTRIARNYFHDISGRSIAWGIYFDEGSAGIIAEENLVVGTSHGGFHQHYGKDNIIRNNVFAFGRDAQLWKTRREDHHAFTLTGNLIVWTGDHLLMGDWGGSDYTLEKNLYWRTDGGEVRFPGGVDLATWQAAGHDAGSVVSDAGIPADRVSLPGYAATPPAPGSGPARVGFHPFDVRDAGPRRE